MISRLLAAFICVAGMPACTDARDGLFSDAMLMDDAIPEPILGKQGRADIGAQIFEARESGHCVLCHQVSSSTSLFQGNLGPNLDTVGDRLSAGQIRLRLVDYQRVRPGTVMPSYYRIKDLYQVGTDFEGQPILTAQEIEDLVAYLTQLRETEYAP